MRRANILGIINARGGSKGIPRKNIKELCGKPLISYSIEIGLNCPYIDHLIVSTDDEEIAQTAKDLGAQVPFIRPKELATDNVKQINAVLHAVQFMEKKNKRPYEYIVLLQPTAPMRTLEDVNRCMEMLLEPKVDSVISFTPVELEHPYIVYSIENDRPKKMMDIEEGTMQRQDYPKFFRRNGAFYGAKREIVVNKCKFFGSNCRAYIMPIERSINIDSLFDWQLAEIMMEQKQGVNQGG